MDNQSLPACESVGTALQAQTNPPHCILVVDDDISLRELNTKVLVRSGYDVDAAEDGAAAWEALDANSYDLVITDNNMPKVSGVELLKKMRAARMDLPVIMATGTLPKEQFTLYPWLQPAATLIKPYTFEELLRTVKKVLREADRPIDAPRPGPANSPQRILVVDEDRDLRQLYAEALAGPGYDVDVADDGATGWAALQANHYHLLITEHDLPNLTGLELVRKLRAARMALPVVLAVGRLPTRELAESPALELAAMLVKPFAVEVLLDTVKNVLQVTNHPSTQINQMPDWSGTPTPVGLQLGRC